MTVIHYRPARLGFTALICALVAALGLWFAASGSAGIVSLLAAAIPGYLAFVNGRAALGANPALRFDEHGVSVSTLTKTTNLRWDEIRDIRTQSLTLRYMGIIPVSRQDFITFVTKGGPFSSKSLKLAGAQLELPARGILGLHRSLCAFLGDGLTTASPATAAAPAPAEEGGTFDPDAAIARYLAAKQAEAEAAGAAPASPFVSAPRPVFGRRQA